MILPFKKISQKLIGRLSGTASSDIEEAGRRNLFAVFLVLLIAPLLIFGTYLIKTGFYGYGIVDYVVALLFIIFLFVFRKAHDAKVFYRIALSLLCFLMVYWVNTGAARGYGSLWVLTIPPFAFFLLGRKEGVIWTLFVFGVTTAFFLFPALSVNGFVYEADFISRYLFTLFLIVLFIYNYELMREKYKKAMEREQSKLHDEKELLAEAKNNVEAINARLNEEMNIRRKAEEDLRSHRDHLEEIVIERTLELRNTNAMLAANEKRYRLMADNITDMIWTADMNLLFTFISSSVTRIFGYTVEEAMNLSLNKLTSSENFDKIIRGFREQLELEKTGGADPDRYVNIELEHIRKDGEVIPVEVTVSFLRNSHGEAIGIVGITRDISERIKAQDENRKMQEQLAQAQKMEAIGTLVSGIAHDFNNILGGIIGSYELLIRMLKDEKLQKRGKVDKYLKLGMESSLRSAELIKQLLSFSRKHEITLTPVDINESLGHVIEICRNSLPKVVEIDYMPSDIPLVVMGDVIQIEQVFLNLCINASHAMTIMRRDGEKSGGVLKLRASKVQSDYFIKELYPDCDSYEETWVKVEVFDTGVGMDNETRNRIFEPFFSMKEQNEGSGLGLSISYNIVRQHRGLIHIYSEPGKGSRFSVYIPSYENIERGYKNRKGFGEISMGSGTVLVIDDEHIMLSVAKGFLEESGYSVIIADSGDEGINIYRRLFDEISAVLIDLSMPGKSGLEVFMELKDINSDVKVILASGMLDQESKLAADTIGIKGVVNKPYLIDELSLILKSIL